MAKECTIEVDAGVCKMKTMIHAVQDDATGMVRVEIKSDCHNILRFSWRFPDINPYTEIESPMCETDTYRHASKYIPHAACPIPCAVIRAVEVASDMGIRRDITINYVD